MPVHSLEGKLLAKERKETLALQSARLAKGKKSLSSFNSWPRTSCQSKNPSPVAVRPKLKITLWLVWANMSLFRCHKRILWTPKKAALSRAFFLPWQHSDSSPALISAVASPRNLINWCDSRKKCAYPVKFSKPISLEINYVIWAN